MTLPNENIVPVFRSDTSGPGYDLDQYLIDTVPTWTGAIGTTARLDHVAHAGRATGTPGQQLNAGVATYIQQTEGAIGYVEYSYALEANFTNAALHEPRAAAYVAPVGQHYRRRRCDQASALSSTNFNIVYAAGGLDVSAGQLQLGPHLPEAGRTPTPASSWASSSNG